MGPVSLPARAYTSLPSRAAQPAAVVRCADVQRRVRAANDVHPDHQTDGIAGVRRATPRLARRARSSTGLAHSRFCARGIANKFRNEISRNAISVCDGSLSFRPCGLASPTRRAAGDKSHGLQWTLPQCVSSMCPRIPVLMPILRSGLSSLAQQRSSINEPLSRLAVALSRPGFS